MKKNLSTNSLNNIKTDLPILPISTIAEILKVHQRTLRIYDEQNLLKPKRSDGNRRMYSMKDLEKGHFIQFLTRELGINLTGVKIIFELLEIAGIDESNYKKRLEKIAENINLTEADRAENILKHQKKGRKKAV